MAKENRYKILMKLGDKEVHYFIVSAASKEQALRKARLLGQKALKRILNYKIDWVEDY